MIPRETALRNTAMMCGTLAGSATVRKMRRSPAPNVRAMRIMPGSMSRMPAVVLITTGQTASRYTKATLEPTPMPSVSTRIGTSATIGVAKSADTAGSVSSRTVRYQPARRPKGMPVTTTRSIPSTNSCALTAMWCAKASSPKTAGAASMMIRAGELAVERIDDPERRDELPDREQRRDPERAEHKRPVARPRPGRLHADEPRPGGRYGGSARAARCTGRSLSRLPHPCSA